MLAPGHRGHEQLVSNKGHLFDHLKMIIPPSTPNHPDMNSGTSITLEIQIKKITNVKIRKSA